MKAFIRRILCAALCALLLTLFAAPQAQAAADSTKHIIGQPQPYSYQQALEQHSGLIGHINVHDQRIRRAKNPPRSP